MLRLNPQKWLQQNIFRVLHDAMRTETQKKNGL